MTIRSGGELSPGLLQQAELHRPKLSVVVPRRLVRAGVHALVEREEDGAGADVEERGLEHAGRLQRT